MERRQLPVRFNPPKVTLKLAAVILSVLFAGIGRLHAQKSGYTTEVQTPCNNDMSGGEQRGAFINDPVLPLPLIRETSLVTVSQNYPPAPPCYVPEETPLPPFTASGTVIFDTDALTYGGLSGGTEMNGVAVFIFESVNVPAGSTIRGIGSRPLAIVTTGAMTIGGVVQVNGSNATPTAPSCQFRTPSPGGAGGGAGGLGIASGAGVGQPGQGPGGGGASGSNLSGGGGGGFGGNGGNGGNNSGSGGLGGGSYGDLFSMLQGGSGGGGGSATSLCSGASGGGGGGALLLQSNCTLTISGTVSANGGNGALSDTGASGGGSGGAIVLKAGKVNITGSVQARGGNGGAGGCCGGSGGGGGGRVLIYNLNVNSGSVSVNGGSGGSGNSGGSSGVIGVTSSSTFPVAVPVFTSVPANVTVQCSAIPPVGNPTATQGCGGAATVTYNNPTIIPGNCTDNYTLIRQWTASDACGNTATATQRITVRDTQVPIFTSVPANVTVQCNAVPPSSPVPATAIDNCDASVSITVNDVITPGACSDAYTILRRFTAADNCGNTRTATQRITVIDTQKPTFVSPPPSVTVECSDPLPPVATPSAMDNCDASVTVAYLGQTTANSSCANGYELSRRWRATDNCGNTTQYTQVITVQDTQAPTFSSVPEDMTIECSDPLPFPGTATATDNCNGFVQVLFQGETRTDGNCLYNFTITRVWKAIDLCGNSATASQVITVQDTESPSFVDLPVNITVNCSNIPDIPVLEAQDNCGPAPVTFVGQNQSSGNCQTGYTITRTWTATDLCSNITTYTQTITVQGQGLVDPSGDRQSLTAGQISFPVALIPNPAYDAVQIRFSLDKEMESTIVICDLSGRVVHTRQYMASSGENTYYLELGSLSGGIYLVQVSAGDKRAIEKMVVLD